MVLHIRENFVPNFSNSAGFTRLLIIEIERGKEALLPDIFQMSYNSNLFLL